MGGAQYRPIMKGLDRPAAGGRDWDLLVGGKLEVGVAHSSMGTGDWPEENNTRKKQTNRGPSGRQPMTDRQEVLSSLVVLQSLDSGARRRWRFTGSLSSATTQLIVLKELH